LEVKTSQMMYSTVLSFRSIGS